MNTVATANLVGITGIARRLVLDGALEEQPAREAMAAATAERKPLATYLIEKKLVNQAQLAAAHSIEFGVPLFDVVALDANQSAIKLVSEELVRKHSALPLFRRGNKLFVGLADPTNTRAPPVFAVCTMMRMMPVEMSGPTPGRPLTPSINNTTSALLAANTAGKR